jgi:hypothetical protein
MRTGKTLVELAQILLDIQENSRDFAVPTSRLEVKNHELAGADGKSYLEPMLSFVNGEEHAFELNPWSTRQLATYADVPTSYFERIKRENLELFNDIANHGLQRKVQTATPGKLEARMVRTHKGKVRAFVSDRYRRLDNYDLLETIAPVILDSDMQIVSSELTDQRMYMQMTTPKLQSEVKKGDIVQHGLVISSSDVGAGSVRVEPMIYRLVCTNGMISSTAVRKFHIGKSQGEEEVYELLTDDTKAITDQAFWAQVRDIVASSLQPTRFEKEVAKLRAAAEDKITNFDIPAVVELSMRHVSLTGEKIKHSIIANLANGADGAGMTRWGLANAFTAVANTGLVDYDSAIDFERAGSKIIDMPQSAWKKITQAE